MEQRKPKAGSIEDLGMPTFFNRKYAWVATETETAWEVFRTTLRVSVQEQADRFEVTPQQIYNWRGLYDRIYGLELA